MFDFCYHICTPYPLLRSQLKIHGETDGETPVTTAEGLEVANKIGACGFYEISATDGTGVDELLYSATRVAMAKSTIVGSVFKLLKKGIGKMSKGGGGKDASADASADAMFAFGKTTTEQVCPYSSPNGNCKRKFLADEHVIYCDWHTCTNVGCNAKKSKKAAFCPKHVVSSAEKEQWQLGGPAAPSSSLAETFDASNPFGAPPILDLTGGSEMEAFTKNPLRVSKYVAPEIRLGSPMIAAHGLAELLGVSSEHQGKMMIAKEKAIIAEFNKYGKPEDKDNLKHVLAGTYREDWGRSNALSVSLDALLATDEAKAAHLERHHILALRLYTTSSYKCINEPLRQNPPPKQHPFAATTLFIQDGIKKLRANKIASGGALETQVFWRGMKDRSLPPSFIMEGGAEYACMSTSADFEIAVKFADVGKSASPLIFKYVTTSFMNRGADISFLSVYPEEKEVLYPPLTYLEPVIVKKESIKGKSFMVAEVKPSMA